MFKDMELKKVGNLNDFPVFLKGASHYCDLLDMNLPKVIQGVEDDLERAKTHLSSLGKLKEEKQKKLI